MVATEDFKLGVVYIWKARSGLAWGKEPEEVEAAIRTSPSSWELEDNLGVTELTKK